MISYKISLAVWRILDIDSMANQTTSISVMFLDAPKPKFTLRSSEGKPLASKQNQFEINMENYNAGDSRITITWIVTPNIKYNISDDKYLMTVLKGDFKPSTNYTVSVTVKHKTYAEAVTTNVLAFKTGSLPKDGYITVAPLKGDFMSTEFTVAIYKWVSPNNSPITYTVKGQSINKQIIELTDRSYKASEKFVSQLPQLSVIRVSITDSSGEVVERDKLVEIKISNTVDWAKLIQ